jgi:hypothetical protein
MLHEFVISPMRATWKSHAEYCPNADVNKVDKEMRAENKSRKEILQQEDRMKDGE